MGRRDFVFKWLFYALTALGFVLVQVFGLVHIRIWGVHPFLFPVLVSTVAALESAHESAVFALATGAVLDVTMPGVIPCFYTVAFLVVFLLARVLSAKAAVFLLHAVWRTEHCVHRPAANAVSQFVCQLLRTGRPAAYG